MGMGGRRGSKSRARDQLKESLLKDDGGDSGAPPRPSIGRLFSEAKDEAGALAMATLFLVAAAGANLAVPALAGRLIDACLEVQKGGSIDVAKRAMNMELAQICVILILGAMAGGIRAWLFTSAAERVMYRLRVKLFRSLMSQEVGFFDRVRTGELMNRLSEDTRMMKDAATMSISMALRSVATLCLGMAAMTYTSWQLTAMTLAILPPILGALWIYRRYSQKFTVAQLSSSAEAATVAEEVFSSVRTVRSFAKESAAIERYEDAARDVLKWGLSLARAWVASSTLMFGVAPISLMCIIWYGARLVLDGVMTVGSLNAFILYSITVGSSAGTLASVAADVFMAVGAGARVFELLDRVPKLEHGSGQDKPVGVPEGGHLQIQSVWFAYPSRPSINVLKDFSLVVAPGTKRALVGGSGSGKSTAVHLLERFYDPQQGRLLLDGCDLRSMDHVHLHQQVALVGQEPVLFAETILYNITFGLHSHFMTEEPLTGSGSGGSEAAKPLLPQRGLGLGALHVRRPMVVIDQRRVEEAARQANAHDFIMALPEGYSTIVGERGVRLSGGQKQRVAIARALLLQPRVLLLDEATSALDAESEFLVQQALDTASAGRTVLVVAHRLSTVQNADAISVVSNGRVAEQGTHDQLLASGGIYAALVRRQLAGDDGGESGKGSAVDLLAGAGGVEEEAEADPSALVPK